MERIIKPTPEAELLEKQIGKAACNLFYRQPRGMYMAEGALMNIGLYAADVQSAAAYIGPTALVVAGGISILAKDLLWRELEVGDHMRIFPERHIRVKSLKLSDSTIVSPGELVGRIHFDNNIKKLDSTTSMVTYTRELYRSGHASLTTLAKMCQEEKPVLDDINVFWGRSHLVGNFTKNLGFDTFPVKNPIARKITKRDAKGVVEKAVGKHAEWKSYQKNMREPKDAYISRKKLIAIFGEKK